MNLDIHRQNPQIIGHRNLFQFPLFLPLFQLVNYITLPHSLHHHQDIKTHTTVQVFLSLNLYAFHMITETIIQGGLLVRIEVQ